MRWVLLAAMTAASVLVAADGSAAISVPAKVRYEKGDGYNAWVASRVKFATGSELNQVTGSQQYNGSIGRYAIIPLTDSTYDVVQLAGGVDCGALFSQACLPPSGHAEGFDPSGRHWQICLNPKCDP